MSVESKWKRKRRKEKMKWRRNEDKMKESVSEQKR